MALQVLEDSLGKTVLLRLRGGKSIRGQLTGFDQHLNLVLEKAEDVTDTNEVEELGLILVRGDNVVMISHQKQTVIRGGQRKQLVKGLYDF
jgi:small nuclear ribonucleoprotein